jgi:hypothetical protein|tara:strand:+ start:4928 stop:5284 length:357 start_codon:yes stop_codon:yes gene_type:complete
MARNNISNKQVRTMIIEGFAFANQNQQEAEVLRQASIKAFDRLEAGLITEEYDRKKCHKGARDDYKKSQEMHNMERGYMRALYQLADMIGVRVHQLDDINVKLEDAIVDEPAYTDITK